MPNSYLAITYQLLDEGGQPFLKGQKITTINEPGLNCIRKIDVYTQGRFGFSIDNYNFKNYMRRLRGDQAKLSSTLEGMSGYGLDQPPMTNPMDGPQNLRRRSLTYSRDWALKSPLNIWPFIDAGSNSLVHSDSEIAIEIFFEVIRDNLC